MSAAGTRESWDAGGLAFSQPSVGVSDAEAEEVWDDRAILKAFDDALNTHTRKPVNGVEARKWDKHAAQGVATPPVMDNRGPPPPGSRDGQGSQQGDRRFASLLTAKGGAEAAAARQAAGVPGPWEPVAGSREGEGQETAMPKGEAGQRFEYAARNGPYDNQRGEEFGAHHYPPGAPHPPPHGGGPLEEGWDRQGLPPPPPPPMPHGGAGPHAAAFQSLDGVYDDDLADLLLAWYYSGYYTGRYRALQDARNPRYRRNYPAMPGHGPPAHGPPAHGPPAKHGSPAQHAPPVQHGPLTPSSAANHGEAWERQGWQGHPAAPGFGPSPAGRAGHADARGGGGGGGGPAGRRPGSASGP